MIRYSPSYNIFRFYVAIATGDIFFFFFFGRVDKIQDIIPILYLTFLIMINTRKKKK